MSVSVPRAAPPVDPEALLHEGLAHHAAGRPTAAREAYQRVLALDSDHAVALHHLGLIAHAEGAHAEAATLVERAIAQNPADAMAFSNLGAIRRAEKRHAEAIAALRQAIALAPTAPQPHSNLGGLFEDMGAPAEALAAYRRAMACDPNFLEAHTNAASLLRRAGQHEEAAALCADLVARRPDAARAHAALGRILREMHRKGDARAAYERALALQPNLLDVHIGLGHLAVDAGDIDAAITHYERAIALKPDLAEAYFNLGAAHEARHDYGRALPMFKRAVELAPDMLGARYEYHHARLYACDWDGIEAEEAAVLAGLEAAPSSIRPFPLVAMDCDPALQYKVAARWAQRYGEPVAAPPRPETTGLPARRLRIGYVSSDFFRHATANLMVELFERHDRTRFETFAYCHSPEDGSDMRLRVKAAFEHFILIGDLSTADAVLRIRDDGIDILIDLKGYTRDNRLEVFAARPAPIQASFIGFPSTTACDFLDYVIADPVVLPFAEQPHWSEHIVHLPDCYQPNDSQRRITSRTPSRAECGLPAHGFVFCSFNNPYKITPAIFDVWMRLLAATPGAVFWVYAGNGLAKANLRKEAQVRGIDPDRLVFAPPVALPDHLARHRLADLFLDTLLCNAHTTTSDALWAGLPVLTCPGRTFASRVAGSLLHAVGLPELLRPSLADYEATALRLARNPNELAALKARLAANRLTAPLFDTNRFARHLEAAFVQMWEAWAAGKPAHGFAVAPLAPPPAAAVTTTAPGRVLYATCPLCGDPSIHADARWRTCAACGHEHAASHFTAEAEARLFGADVPAARIGTDMESERPVAARIVARTVAHTACGDWLDIGCGRGSLLFAAAEWGFGAVGLDLRPTAVATLRSLGLEAHEGTLATFVAPGRFAVVSVEAAFSRTADPRKMLREIKALLRSGGLILIAAPNVDSMVFKLLDATSDNPHRDDLGQIHLYGRLRLGRLLVEAGFTPLSYAASERSRAAMEIIARRD